MSPQIATDRSACRDRVAVAGAIAKDDDAVGDLDQLFLLAGHDDDRAALRRQASDDLVDFRFGADVDAFGRLVEQEQLRRLQRRARANSAFC